MGSIWYRGYYSTNAEIARHADSRYTGMSVVTRVFVTILFHIKNTQGGIILL